MQPVQGIHHITALARDPQTNVDFYHRVLGQRLVKTTVNFDDPGTYHLYYGDAIGTPGSVLTFFPFANAGRGRRGNGEVAGTAYTVRPSSLEYWLQRLSDHGAEPSPIEERFGRPVVTFEGPEGTSLELVVTEEPSAIQPWRDGSIPEEHVIRGFYGATLWVDSIEPTAEVLTTSLGFEPEGQEGARYRFRGASGDVGSVIDVVERPNEKQGRAGAGSVHHIAFRTVDDEEQAEYLTALRGSGLFVTPVQDRQYFRSIYFREPNGVLFEIATDAPGFDADESVDELGTHLKLPSWYEAARASITRSLRPFTHPNGESMPRPAKRNGAQV